MFGLALAAFCMPSHDDWLNDLSSTPPVSRTMQASTVLPAVADEVPLEAGADVLPPPLLLLPHAVSASATAATPAITALVRRPRTMNVPSKTGVVDTPALSYLRHGIEARCRR